MSPDAQNGRGGSLDRSKISPLKGTIREDATPAVKHATSRMINDANRADHQARPCAPRVRGIDTSASKTALNPRSLVQKLSIETLIKALIGDTHPFAFVENTDGSITFICPHCGYCDHNGGSAFIVDGWRFRCRRCRFTGTRPLIERLILESADALDALYRLIAGGAI